MEHTPAMPRPLDPGTYGKGRTIEILTELLNAENDRDLVRRVTVTIKKYRKTLTALRELKDLDVYETLIRSLRLEMLETVRNMVAPEKVKVYLSNYLVTLYRKEMHMMLEGRITPRGTH